MSEIAPIHLDPVLTINGTTVLPGKKQRLEIPVARLPTQTMLSLPVTVVTGLRPGPRLWLSAAIHGDELNGVDIIRRVLAKISPGYLSGTVIAVPIVNVFGFIEQSRYLPDRRDLNRSFPGSPRGSLAARLAHLFMKEVVSQCTHGIDLHTAAYHRTNLPQIRANLRDEQTRKCAIAFGAPLMMQSAMRDGSLRQAAAQQGIPILLYEGGEALRFDDTAIAVGVTGILRVMKALSMYDSEVKLSANPPVAVEKSQWVRASHSGILHMTVNLGDWVARRQRIGSISDAFGDRTFEVLAPTDGIVIGCTRNPLINQGDAIVNLAIAHRSDLYPDRVN